MGMGLVGLLNFAVACFDVLAWPVFAVCYPLCVSIQAIEADSISDTKKLITYWVSFSLILLFEYAFEKILEWLPSWDYIKLMVVFCLVMPHFNGSLYVYRHLVHPCLSVDPKSVINHLIKLKDFFLNEYNLLAEMEKDVKENGTDALDNRIASKITCIDLDLPMVHNRASAPHDPPEIATAVEAGDTDGLLQIPASKQVQKQWTCAICQLTLLSETDLISHLQGKRHKDAWELLNVKKQKSNVPSSTAAAFRKELLENDLTFRLCNTKLNSVIDARSRVVGKDVTDGLDNRIASKVRCLDPDLPMVDNRASAPHDPPEIATAVEAGDTGKGARELLNAKKQKSNVPSSTAAAALKELLGNDLTCTLCNMKLKSEIDAQSHVYGKRHKAALEEQKAKVLAPFQCIMCNVSCTSQGDMNFHLAGKKHLARMKKLNGGGGCNPLGKKHKATLEEQKAEVQASLHCIVCNVSCTSQGDMDCHLGGKKHLARMEELNSDGGLDSA